MALAAMDTLAQSQFLPPVYQFSHCTMYCRIKLLPRLREFTLNYLVYLKNDLEYKLLKFRSNHNTLRVSMLMFKFNTQ